VAKLQLIRTDLDKTEDGVWVKYLDDVELCIASVNNKAYREACERLWRPHLREMRMKQMSTQAIAELTKPAVAQHLLKGWKNIQDDDGAEIPYSPQKALDLLRDPALQDFYNFVVDVAAEAQNYRQELLEDSEKNS
jgi:hypothetical protein